MPFKILIADDENTTRKLLESLLLKNGYEVLSFDNGASAFKILKEQDGPKLAILDWIMPGLQGIDICRKIRALKFEVIPYLIMLTASMKEKKDIIETFRSGANDFIEKPFNANELLGRVKIGEDMINLQISLIEKNRALDEAHRHIKMLQGILPICMHCHKIKNDNESWERLEEYIASHSDAQFSHGLCPDCMKKHYSAIMAKK